ncbi:MAG: 4Fe-4S binding protein [Bryobacterales bacterium]|nr:4Fe-4S binding protein [Bryobacterales bacterium]
MEPSGKKKLVRRQGRDNSQLLRRWVQVLFLALNVWIGIQFFLFVRHYETGGRSVWVQRPPGVEGWLPIASLMNLKVFLLTGDLPRLHPAGMFLLISFLAISLVFRKAFCSWLCPVGTISEWLWKLGRRAFRRTFFPPRWADIGLRSLKYILLGVFLYAVGSMPVAAIQDFLEGPYGVISDVKMLNFFRYLGVTGALVLGALVLASVLIQNFWCRYLCPYGAMLGLVAKLSPARIRRAPEPCIDCAKCAKACPSHMAVDKLITIGSAECTGCLECVAACPAQGALFVSLPRQRVLPAWAMAAGIAILFFGVVAGAQWAGYWHTNLPASVYMELIPRARQFSHP